MPDISIVKLKVRRGSDDQRRRVVLDQGELGFTTDTKRMFVGDGSLSGGNVVGSKNFGKFNLESGLGTVVGAQIGDIGYANSKLYALTASSYDSLLNGWSYIGSVPDNDNIEFTASNTLTIKQSSLDADDLAESFFGAGLERSDAAINLSLNTDFLNISSTKLSLKSNSITEREIKTTALSSGLVGGNNVPIKVDIGEGLEFNSNGQLIPAGAGSNTVSFSSFKSDTFGEGFIYNDTTKQIDSIISTVNNNSFAINNSVLSLQPRDIEQISNGFQTVTFDNFGIAQTLDSAFSQALTATTLSGGDSVPIGAILPHAAAIGQVPDGYFLCDGTYLSKVDYNELFQVIGTNYGDAGADFRLPNLTGGNVQQYGSDTNPNTSSTVWYVTGATTETPPMTSLSAVATNYIIKYTSNIAGIFTGSPNQVSMSTVHTGTKYTAIDSGGNIQILSSAGFLTVPLSGTTQDGDNFDRFAIPIFNY